MVRVLAASVTLALASQVNAFAPINAAGRMGTGLSASKNIAEVKNTIANLDKDNFSASIAEVEPFLLNDAGASIYKKSMRRITTAANLLGVEVPAEYAKAAKATQKRREKQDAFIQQKEAERLEAEATAAPAEEEAAVEESEPVAA
jgi:hypothetical protein